MFRLTAPAGWGPEYLPGGVIHCGHQANAHNTFGDLEMGTRSLTVIADEEGKEICVMYRQFDGYPTGHGQELAEFLCGKRMVDGMRDHNHNQFNGAACMAASIVAHFKEGPGGIYLHPAGTSDCWEDYIYTVRSQGVGRPVRLTVTPSFGGGEDIFDGPADAFDGKEVEENMR